MRGRGLGAAGWRVGVRVPASPGWDCQICRSTGSPECEGTSRQNKVPLKSREQCQICHLLPFPLPGSWQPGVVRRGVKGRNKPKEERCSKGCAKMPDSDRISTSSENKLRFTELVRYPSTYLAKSTVTELRMLYI